MEGRGLLKVLGVLLAIAAGVAGLAYFSAVLYAASDGIGHFWGGGWATAIIIASLVLRFSLPIVIGAFLGAWLIWHWHWAAAALFASPGLLLMVPAAVVALATMIADRARVRRRMTPEVVSSIASEFVRLSKAATFGIADQGDNELISMGFATGAIAAMATHARLNTHESRDVLRLHLLAAHDGNFALVEKHLADLDDVAPEPEWKAWQEVGAAAARDFLRHKGDGPPDAIHALRKFLQRRATVRFQTSLDQDPGRGEAL